MESFMKYAIFILCLILTACAPNENNQRDYSVDPREPEYPFRDTDLPPGTEVSRLGDDTSRSVNQTLELVRFAGEERQTCVDIADGKADCVSLKAGNMVDYELLIGEEVYIIRFLGSPPPAVFPPSYRRSFQDKVTVLNTPAYELMNVAIAMTTTGQSSDNDLVYRDGEYYTKVQDHFSSHSKHPFIVWLEGELSNNMGHYSRLKMNAHAFNFSAENILEPSTIYKAVGFPGQPNYLMPQLDNMRDFANASDFLSFYKENQNLYNGQTRLMQEDLDAQGMLNWLNKEFPSVEPYDHVKVLFSPLVYGWQSVTTFDDGVFKELQPHINFPYSGSRESEFTPEGHVIYRSDLLFTEMNHGFINKTAELFAPRIQTAMPDLSRWVRPDSSAASYGSAISTFNEMMNWALVGIYYEEKAPKADQDPLFELLVKQQVENRGFLEFEGFSKEVLRLRRKQNGKGTVEDLYPDIVAWLESY